MMPGCAVVSGLLLQRAAQSSAPGPHLDRCSQAIMCVVRPKGEPRGKQKEIRLGSPWSYLRLVASLNKGLSSVRDENHLLP